MSLAEHSLIRSAKLTVAALGIVAIFVAIALSLHHPKPVPLNQVAGVFANPDCGSLTFSNGTMSWGNSHSKYTLESDKVGLFALPDHFVGISTVRGACLVSVDKSKSPLKLRFDDEERPRSVALWRTQPPSTFTFSRQLSSPNGG